MEPNPSEVSKTFLKGLGVLQSYQNGPPAMTLAELSRRTGYDRATVRRLCFSLLHAGLMIQTGREFRLSPRVVTLASGFLQSNGFGKDVNPILNQYAKTHDLGIGLFVRDGDNALLIAQSITEHGNGKLGMNIGSVMPLLPTAVGRLLLSDLPQEERSAAIKDIPIEAYTTDTKTSLIKILSEIDLAAFRKFAVVKGEYIAKMCGIAVPVRVDGRIKAVLGTITDMPAQHVERNLSDTIETLRQAARDLEKIDVFAHW